MKKPLPVISAAVASLLWAALAHSQVSCGGGFIQEGGGNAGWINCILIEAPPASVSLQNPGPQWAARWGAIAFDDVDGKFAGIDKSDSKHAAEAAAIQDCRKFGGKNCKLLISYRNQCGVMVAGDSFTTAGSGPTFSETAQRAVSRCTAKTPNCKIFYYGCSFPERIP